MSVPKDYKTIISRIFTENKSIKLLAMVITLVLFSSVRAQEKVERWVDVEVEMVLPSKQVGLVVTTAAVNTVRVHIRGSRSIVNDIRDETGHSVKMDLSDISRPGMSTFFFEPEMFSFSGVEITDVNPSAVSVRVEKLIARKLPVRVKTVGRLAAGTRFDYEPVVSPASVMATGPSSIIHSITSVETQEIGIDGLTIGPYEEEVPLTVIDGVQFKQNQFNVKFKIAPILVQRTFTGLLVQSNVDNGENVIIHPAEVAVSLAGPKSVLDGIDPSGLVARVTIDGTQDQQPPEERGAVIIDGVPDQVEVVTIAPAFVRVERPAR